MISYNIFHGGASHVFTMSYDDGQIEDRRLVALMNKYGIKGTFNLNSGRLSEGRTIDESEVKELYAGHEVAVHTVTHPSLHNCQYETVFKEIAQDRQKLESLVGYPVRGMAYPNGSFNDKIVEIARNAGIVYSRTVLCDGFNIPTDFMRLKATCHQGNCLEWLEKFEAWHDVWWRSGLCFYVWGHSYELNSEEKWEMIETLFKRITAIDGVWYATNIEIYDYIDAQKRLRISYDETVIENPSNIDVWVRKDGSPVKIPKCSVVTL